MSLDPQIVIDYLLTNEFFSEFFIADCLKGSLSLWPFDVYITTPLNQQLKNSDNLIDVY